MCFFISLQHIVPFIYVLMSCKKQICYAHILDYIHDNICSLEGATFMTDYEHAMRNALARRYPNMALRCCWFHFCQAVKRNGSKTAGFIHLIRNNLIEREVYYKLMCLPLLPSSEIVGAFETLQAKAAIVNHGPFKLFLEYFHRQWIVNVCIYFVILFMVHGSFAFVFYFISFAGRTRSHFG